MERIYAEDWFKKHQIEIKNCGEVIRDLQREGVQGKKIVEIALEGIFLPIAIDFNKTFDKNGFSFRDERNKDRFQKYKALMVHIGVSLSNFLQEDSPTEERYNEFLRRENDAIDVLLNLDFSTVEEISKAQEVLKDQDSKVEPLRELPPSRGDVKQYENTSIKKGRYVDEAA